MSTVPSSPHVFNPEPLTVQLAQAGFANGAPAHLSVFSVAVDVWTAKRMQCPHCGRRGMAYKPFQRAGAYRAVAVCRKCGAQEEV